MLKKDGKKRTYTPEAAKKNKKSPTNSKSTKNAKGQLGSIEDAKNDVWGSVKYTFLHLLGGLGGLGLGALFGKPALLAVPPVAFIGAYLGSSVAVTSAVTMAGGSLLRPSAEEQAKADAEKGYVAKQKVLAQANINQLGQRLWENTYLDKLPMLSAKKTTATTEQEKTQTTTPPTDKTTAGLNGIVKKRENERFDLNTLGSVLDAF